ncbi:uncharacterized protein LOC113312216 [Papaver somniferum]|uniref:uncharacterized protein LOC113312216 n=1 Tax=Papaver somniferum TaxID=3469 RepID=UPI000E6F9284|nr:uncharacterized protein LOC113312216 [Papaver somniferum]
MGNSLGRSIRVDETTLKREIGYYASVLVEMDMSNYIPNKIWVESKYGSFEQRVHIPKVLKFCIHCQVVGHSVTECRSKNKVPEHGEAELVIQTKKIWRRVKNKTKVGFDICFGDDETTHNTQHVLDNEDEIFDAIIPPISKSGDDNILDENKQTEVVVNSVLSASKFLEVTSSAPSINEVVTVIPPLGKFGSNVENQVKQKTGANVTTRKQAASLISNLSKNGNLRRAKPKIRYSTDFIKKLKLAGMHYEIIHNSSELNKGNIWMLWSDSIKPPSIVSCTSQEITISVGDTLITGVHASSLTVDRRELWNKIEEINSLNKPWLVIGDFTVVTCQEEKVGGLKPLRISMLEFNNCLSSCSLISSPKTVLEFSWCNNRAGRKRIVCNLDRVVFNDKWLELYPSWGYKIGARGISDHGVLYGASGDIPKQKNVPFKALKLKQVEEDVMKAILLSDRNPLDLHLLNKLVTFKRATREKQEDGITSNQEEIAGILVKHFEDKFTFQEVSMATSILNDIPEVVNEEENDMIEATPNTDEIREAVFDLNPDSAPGPDGFDGWFYREVWEIIGEDFIRAIQFWWSRGFIPNGLNANFLLLLPKVKNAKRSNQFRPIGLMNFSFKVITKSITKRLTEIIKKMVSPQQGSFIKGRNIQEKIALASELVNDLEHKRRGGNMGLKLDITQAYDSLSWEFMFQVMQKFGFSNDIFIFCNADKRNVRKLLKVLQEYQAASGQVISLGTKQMLYWCFPIYTMAVYKWPRTIIKECERIIRNFLWTGDPSSRKVITLKWDSVCSPIDEGGLGLRRLEILNKARLIKLFWKIINGDDEMSRYFQAKYQDRNGDWIRYYRKSSVWPDGEWVIPTEMLEMFDISELPAADNQEDRRVWSLTITGEFTVASAVESIRKKFPKLQWT